MKGRRGKRRKGRMVTGKGGSCDERGKRDHRRGGCDERGKREEGEGSVRRRKRTRGRRK